MRIIKVFIMRKPSNPSPNFKIKAISPLNLVTEARKDVQFNERSSSSFGKRRDLSNQCKISVKLVNTTSSSLKYKLKPLPTVFQELQGANLDRIIKTKTAANHKNNIFEYQDMLKRNTDMNFMKRVQEPKVFRISHKKLSFDTRIPVQSPEIRIKKTSEELNNDFNKLISEENDEIYDKIIFGEVIGEGSYSIVYKILIGANGKFLAAKKIGIQDSGSEKHEDQLRSLSKLLVIS